MGKKALQTFKQGKKQRQFVCARLTIKPSGSWKADGKRFAMRPTGNPPTPTEMAHSVQHVLRVVFSVFGPLLQTNQKCF